MNRGDENDLNNIFKYSNLDDSFKVVFKKNLKKIRKMRNFDEGFEFIVEKQRQLNGIKDIDNIEILFQTIETNHFKSAKFLVKNGTPINSINESSNNVLEYLQSKNKLNEEKLLFVLNTKKDLSMLTTDILLKFIKQSSVTSIKNILNFSTFNIDFIKEILFLYKNRKALSKKEYSEFWYNSNNVFNLNDKVSGETPFTYALTYRYNSLIKLFIEYADRNSFTLELNEKNSEGEPAILDIFKHNEENPVVVIPLLIEHANKNKYIIDMNVRDKNGDSFFSKCINCKDSGEIAQILFEYIKKNNIILDVEEKDKNGKNLFSNAFYSYSLRILKNMIQYAEDHQLFIDINKNNDDFLFLDAITSDKIDIVRLVIDYATKNNVVVNINGKDKNGNYPLLNAIQNFNYKEIVDLLFEYAATNNIILQLNEKNAKGEYPLLSAVSKNDPELVSQLIDYAEKNNIILNLNKKEPVNDDDDDDDNDSKNNNNK